MGWEWHKACRISIVGCNDLAWAVNCELDVVVGPGRHDAARIGHANRYKGQVATVVLNLFPVGDELQPGCRTCGLHHIRRPDFSLLVCYDLQFSRLIEDVVPAQSILVGAFFLSTERLAIEKEFCLVAGGEDVYRRDLPNALGPRPLRKDMRHGQVGTPVSLVEIEAVFLEARQIDGPILGTARRVERSGLAQIIPAAPDKSACDKGMLVLSGKNSIRRSAEAVRIEFVATDLVCGGVHPLSVRCRCAWAIEHREQIHATPAESGR